MENIKSTRTKIKSIKRVENEDVYDLQVFNNHNFIANGILVSNCGEIVLCADDSCRLICLNLYSYVENPFTDTSGFNMGLFEEHTKWITRMMDNIIDLELEKIDAIIEKINSDPENEEIKQTELNLWKRIKSKCEMGRRTGIGITAEGDMLAALGLKYGTYEATQMAEYIHKRYAIGIYKASIELAKERGSFPIFNYELEANNPFNARIFNEAPELLEDFKKYGRRHIAMSTLAPTGSVSILTQTTSGIEPAFLISYTRRRKINPNDKGVRVDFVDEVGDSWEEYNVFHHKFIDWYMINNPSVTLKTWNDYLEYLEKLPKSEIDNLIQISPYFEATANDVNWVEKVKMQGDIQKWIDHSISVTVNLPNSVTEELVNQVYLTGWKSGCKGVTIYRDGSRSGVLVTKEEDKSSEDITDNFFKEHHAPKRPKKLDCDVFRFVNKGKKWIAFISTYHERPYEIFTGEDIFDNLPSNVEKGFMTKTKVDNKSEYHFSYVDKEGKEIKLDKNVKISFDPIFYDTAKMISAIMRHGMPIPYIIDLLDSLNLDGDFIVTWKSAVKRLLKKYLKEDSVMKGAICPSCNSVNLMMIEGCLTCKDCGNSKCG